MKSEAEKIIKKHAVLSMSAGFIPIPVFDLVTVTALQLDMLKQLAVLYKVDFDNDGGKTFLSALTGGTLAKIGGSLVKSIPGVGSFLGGLSMAAISGATTYAAGEIACRYFEKKNSLSEINLDKVKDYYEEALKKGKEYISSFTGSGETGSEDDITSRINNLKKLHKEELISDEEFEEYRKKILDEI